jgi:hypothetical protein
MNHLSFTNRHFRITDLLAVANDEDPVVLFPLLTPHGEEDYHF